MTKIREAYRVKVRHNLDSYWLPFLIAAKSSGEAIAAVERYAGFKVLTVEYVRL